MTQQAGYINHQDQLNRMNPASAHASLGSVVYDLINALNDLHAKYVALLTHMDTANVAGLGAANAATYGPTLPPVKLPEQR